MRTVEQLSIFLENKVGRLQQIMEVLGKIDAKIIAAMVSDTSEYGILRLITTDTRRVYDILKQN
ncbi:MAG: acetolactate synthase, partial [Rikenellaceae bacterium]